MNISQIQKNIENLIESPPKETFIYDLLTAYGVSKTTISRLRNGNINLSKNENEISWKKKLLFKKVNKQDLTKVFEQITKDTSLLKNAPRFVLVTDFEQMLSLDIKTKETLNIDISDLSSNYVFFLPWAGMEKTKHVDENPADVKAAEKMAKFFDQIKKDNPDNSPEFIHSLNVFLCRLLFCLFAEDTNIFEQNQITNLISSHTQEDGSALNAYLDKLFEILNTEERKREDVDEHLKSFPYVNGGLFRLNLKAPIFTKKSRQALIDAGKLYWKDINPDIFGSMMQSVIDPGHRGGLGIHYTSVPNIMKVIEPLFLNELYEEYESGKYEPKKLNSLLERISTIKIFDPACGSGNFLIIAYKELRKLEIQIIKQFQELFNIVNDHKLSV